jgi:hypothetical protein
MKKDLKSWLIFEIDILVLIFVFFRISYQKMRSFVAYLMAMVRMVTLSRAKLGITYR